MTGARQVLRAGETALLVGCHDLADVLAVRAHLLLAPLPGQVDVQAGACTVLVVAADRPSAHRIEGELATLDAVPAPDEQHTVVEIDVVYDGPDLDEVARRTGLTRDGVVRAHTGLPWAAAFGGFAPGFMYLTGGAGLDVPRRDEPRTAVPAGSVALAAGFSAVYPRRSPGGWQLIGSTSAVLWDVTRAQPSLLSPGDQVRFRAVRATATTTGTGTVGTTRAATPTEPVVERALLVEAAGALTLVEDLGRPGHRDVGVGPSGAADRGAAARANRLVGNPRGEAVLETVLGGLRVRARGDHVLAVTGATVPLTVSGAGLRSTPGTEAAFVLRDGEALELGTPEAGLRGYLAVRGGLLVEPVMGSRSTDTLAGIGPETVRPGAVLPVGEPAGTAVGRPEAPSTLPLGPALVQVVLGPRTEWFTDGSVARFLEQPWTVTSDADRVGLRLDGAPLVRRDGAELPSEGMVVGAVQVPPSGLPVVLLADHPVTGGYPVVAVVRDADLDRLAQLRPGDVLRFTV